MADAEVLIEYQEKGVEQVKKNLALINRRLGTFSRNLDKAAAAQSRQAQASRQMEANLNRSSEALGTATKSAQSSQEAFAQLKREVSSSNKVLRNFDRTAANEARNALTGIATSAKKASKTASQAGESFSELQNRLSSQQLESFNKRLKRSQTLFGKTERGLIKITQSLRRGESELEQFLGVAKSLRGTITRLGIALGSLAVPAGLIAAVGAISGAVSAATERVRNLAAETGQAVEAFQRLSVVSRQTGLQRSTTAQAVSGLSQTAQRFQSQGNQAQSAGAFQSLGISQRQLSNIRSTTNLLRLVANRIQAIESASDRRNLVQELGLGPRFLRFIREQDEALGDLNRRLIENATVSDRVSDRAEEVIQRFSLLGQTIVSEITRAVARNKEELVSLINKGLNAAREAVVKLENATEGLIRNFEKLATVFTTIAGLAIGSFFGRIGQAIATIVGASLPSLISQTESFGSKATSAFSSATSAAETLQGALNGILRVILAIQGARLGAKFGGIPGGIIGGIAGGTSPELLQILQRLNELRQPDTVAEAVGKGTLARAPETGTSGRFAGKTAAEIRGQTRTQTVTTPNISIPENNLTGGSARRPQAPFFARGLLDFAPPASGGGPSQAFADRLFRSIRNRSLRRRQDLQAALTRRGRQITQFSREQAQALAAGNIGFGGAAPPPRTDQQLARDVRLTELQQSKDTLDGLIEASNQFLEAQREIAQRTSSLSELARNRLEPAFSRAFTNVANSIFRAESAAGAFKNALTTIIDSLAQMILKLTVINPLLNSLFGQSPGGAGRPTIASATGGGGGFSVGSAVNSAIGGFLFGSGGLSGLFGGGGGFQGVAGSVPKGQSISQLGRVQAPNIGGFANGGSFTVGGSGGTDSQFVGFRASPGEKVDVSTPAQQKGKSGPTVVNNIDARGASVEAVQRLEQVVAQINSSIEPRAVAAVEEENARTV